MRLGVPRAISRMRFGVSGEPRCLEADSPRGVSDASCTECDETWMTRGWTARLIAPPAVELHGHHARESSRGGRRRCSRRMPGKNMTKVSMSLRGQTTCRTRRVRYLGRCQRQPKTGTAPTSSCPPPQSEGSSVAGVGMKRVGVRGSLGCVWHRPDIRAGRVQQVDLRR